MFYIRTFLLSLTFISPVLAEVDPIKIGWVGPMSGPNAKYAAYEAAQLAMEEINAAGGINGASLNLVFQDAHGDSRGAVAATQHLLDAEKIKLIIGGHCSPESLPMAPLIQRSGALMLAAITSSPKLTNQGDNIFRITAVSLQGIDVLIPFVSSKLNAHRAAVIYEETDYAIPLAEKFKGEFNKTGKVVGYESYMKGEVDFRSIISRIKRANPDFIYLSIQSPEVSILILKQLADLGVRAYLGGNELMGSSLTAFPEHKELFEGLYFSSPRFDIDSEPTKGFVERYKARFSAAGLPMGIWTAEAFDAVHVMAKAIKDCGPDPSSVRRCLYGIQNYQGVSGEISIDSNGDGIRRYELKQIRNSRIETIVR